MPWYRGIRCSVFLKRHISKEKTSGTLYCHFVLACRENITDLRTFVVRMALSAGGFGLHASCKRAMALGGCVPSAVSMGTWFYERTCTPYAPNSLLDCRSTRMECCWHVRRVVRLSKLSSNRQSIRIAWFGRTTFWSRRSLVRRWAAMLCKSDLIANNIDIPYLDVYLLDWLECLIMLSWGIQLFGNIQNMHLSSKTARSLFHQ